MSTTHCCSNPIAKNHSRIFWWYQVTKESISCRAVQSTIYEPLHDRKLLSRFLCQTASSIQENIYLSPYTPYALCISIPLPPHQTQHSTTLYNPLDDSPASNKLEVQFPAPQKWCGHAKTLVKAHQSITLFIVPSHTPISVLVTRWGCNAANTTL